MPLSLALIVRPSRAAAVAAIVAAVCVAQSAVALRWQLNQTGHGLERAFCAAALLGTAYALGLLAPVHGRGARLGLVVTRFGVVLASVAAALDIVVGGIGLGIIGVSGLLIAFAGVRALAYASRAEGELPSWAHSTMLVGLGAVVLVGPSGGGLVLGVAWLSIAVAIHMSAQRLEHLVPRSA